jgi:hypothetical protein
MSAAVSIDSTGVTLAISIGAAAGSFFVRLVVLARRGAGAVPSVFFFATSNFLPNFR